MNHKSYAWILLIMMIGISISTINAAPVFTPGVWKDITPPGNAGAYAGVITLAIDPSNHSTIYACIQDNGLWRTTDGGSSWSVVGDPTYKYNWDDKAKYLDVPFNVAVDPANSLHIVATDAVRGGFNGFWTTTDGGVNWIHPKGWVDVAKTTTYDMSQMDVDPVDFNHLIISSHGWWGTGAAGIIESKDAGATWVSTPPQSGWSTGTPGIAFLYDPAHGITDNKTWIYLGQGFWRTTNAGTTWTKVSDAGAPHGYDQLYRAKNGTLYGAWQYPWRSTDNGLTWIQLSNNGIPYSVVYAVCGDGENLYTMIDPANGTATPWLTSPENDGLTWKPFNNGTQKFLRGPISMKYDSVTHIMYAACWTYGLWALKVDAGTTNAKDLSCAKNQKEYLYPTSRIIASTSRKSSSNHTINIQSSSGKIVDITGRVARRIGEQSFIKTTVDKE